MNEKVNSATYPADPKEESVKQSLTYLLVPGSIHGAWSWRLVANHLRAAGHRAIPFTLPGLNDGDDPSDLNLHDATDYIVGEVQRIEVDNAILVAHSWGACPATGAAHALGGQVSKLIYFNGYVPPRGSSLADAFSPQTRNFILQMIEASSAGALVPAPEFVEYQLMPGTAPELQQGVAGLLAPQAVRYFLDVIDVDARTLNVPTACIISNGNDATELALIEDFAARLGVEPALVPGTHDGMLSHPIEVTNAILAA